MVRSRPTQPTEHPPGWFTIVSPGTFAAALLYKTRRFVEVPQHGDEALAASVVATDIGPGGLEEHRTGGSSNQVGLIWVVLNEG